jgi:hypothetical protein
LFEGKLGSFPIKAKVSGNAKKRTNRLTSCVFTPPFWTIFEDFSKVMRGHRYQNFLMTV